MTDRGASENRPGRVELSDVQHVLSLFAQGITGRTLPIQPLDTSSSDSRPSRIATDDACLCLPAEVDHFTSRRRNFGAYRIEVLRQIGDLEHGALSFKLDTASTRMPSSHASVLHRALANRSMPTPHGKPVPDLECLFSAWHRPALLRLVFGTLEAMRIDATIRRRYPGAKADLDRVLRHALSGRPSLHALNAAAALVEGLVQFSLGLERAVVESEDETGLQASLLDAAAIVLGEHARVDDSVHAALDICTSIEDLIQTQSRRNSTRQEINDPLMPDGAADKRGRDAPAVRSAAPADNPDDGGHEPFGTSTMDFDCLHPPAGQLRTRMQHNHLSAKPFPSRAEGGVDGQDMTVASTRTSPPLAPRTGLCSPASFFYDEWDYIHRRYLKAWCRISEQRLRGDDFGFIAEVRGRHATPAKQIRQQFGFIKPKSRHRVHRTSDGDELDIDGLVEAVIDRQAGHALDTHFYIRRDPVRRDVCAAFLVDMSASTDFPLPEPNAHPFFVPAESAEDNLYLYGGEEVPPPVKTPPARRVIDVAKDALALMSDALQTLGDSQAIYGFSGDGRDNVEFHIAKEFGDTWSVRTGAALASMQPRRSTRTGPAIRHAITKLARQPWRTKVLIIVSDGYPEDCDYGPNPRDIEYGIQDTARALREAQRAGISTFCIAIDLAGHDYLRRMCPENRYLVIDDVAALPAQLMKVYRTLTADG